MQSSITAWLKKPASVTKPKEQAHVPTQPAPPTQSSVDEVVAPAKVAKKEAPPKPPLTSQSINNPIPKSYCLPSLPPNVELVPLSEDLVPSFKRLNTILLPVAYPSSYYAEAVTEPHRSLTLVALWHASPSSQGTPSDADKPHLIGAIRCRVLPAGNLYLSTIGVLSPYRSHGIATHLLQRLITKASEDYGVKCVTAHVWEANEEGLEWYAKRGFEVIGREEGYYRKLKPGTAVLVRKWIGVSDLLGHSKEEDQR